MEELLDNLTVDEPLKEIFLKLPELLGDLEESVTFIQKRTQNKQVLAALERLMKVESILELYGFLDYITIDFSMLSQYSYYTGVIFKAYTYGSGEALATGGRYDSLVSQFGMDVPAIGLAIVIDQLMLALTRQKLFVEEKMGGVILLYPQTLRKEALSFAEKRRKAGEKVQMLRKSSRKSFEEYKEYAQRAEADILIYLETEEKAMLYETVSSQVKSGTAEEICG